MNKNQDNNISTVKQFYMSLSDVSPRKHFRDSIMQLTGCNSKTFWNWMNSKTIPPALVRKVISEASGVDARVLFDRKKHL